MRTIGILLIIAGGLGLVGSTIAFGDIGLSMGIAGVIGVLAGIGFLIAAEPVNAWKKEKATRLAQQYQARLHELQNPNPTPQPGQESP